MPLSECLIRVEWYEKRDRATVECQVSCALAAGTGGGSNVSCSAAGFVVPQPGWLLVLLLPLLLLALTTHLSLPQVHLERLLQSLEPFYHPSNAGPWCHVLGDLLNALCRHMRCRLKRQRRAPGGPGELRPSQVHRFAETLLPAALTAMFANHPHMTAQVPSSACASVPPFVPTTPPSCPPGGKDRPGRGITGTRG